jgi:uncharacterized protein (UPF0261 family)
LVKKAMKTILLIATLDTKEAEARYVAKAIELKGHKVLVLDCGMSGAPADYSPDIPRQIVAQAAGWSYASVESLPREKAEHAMASCVAAMVKCLYADSKIDGVLGIGGSDGTILATAGMRELPVGVPKLMVSAMACGNIPFGLYVGTRDVTIMPSVVDVAGINAITRRIFDNAVAAICAMAENASAVRSGEQNHVAVTMFGQTTPCGSLGARLLEKSGYTVVTFHPNGTGGPTMEELIREGFFHGVWDLTTQELTEEVVSGGGQSAGRLTAAAIIGIPVVVVPGCMDFIWDAPDKKERFHGRKQLRFNEGVLLGKVKKEEIKLAGALMAERLNQSVGPVTVILPLKGISMFDRPGGELYDPELDAALFTELRQNLVQSIRVMEVDAHINDEVFARACVGELCDILSGVSSRI